MTDQEVIDRLTEIPSRSWDALIFEIKEHIEELQFDANPQLAANHGVISHCMGGIYYLRNLLEQLQSKRNLKK